jgi:hypothetical protein
MMRFRLIVILIFYSIFANSQNVESYIESDTAFNTYIGKIADKHIYMYLQYVNDSTIYGHYHYFQYGESIVLEGERIRDSILLFEFDKNRNKIATLIGRIVSDSIIGKWITLSKDKLFDLKLIKLNTTGDVYEHSIKNNSLVFKYGTQRYSFQVSKYLNNAFNYTYIVLFNKIVNDNFYTVVRYFNYPFIEKAKRTYGYPDTEHYLVFSKFTKNGDIETVQSVKIKSDPDSIKYDVKFGSISSEIVDSLNIDVLHLKEKYKSNISIGINCLECGMKMLNNSINIIPFLYDTLKLRTGNGYDLIIRYKLKHIYGDEDYSYQVDSIYELNNKDLYELSLFCEDIKEYSAYLHNEEIGFGDYKDISFDDYNFDGIDDIYIFDNAGAGATNKAQTIWIFNKRIGKYEKDVFLSRLGIWSIDKKNKIIRSGRKSGYYNYSTEDYQLSNGEWIKIAEQLSKCNEDNTIQTITSKQLVNGTWIEKVVVNKLE